MNKIFAFQKNDQDRSDLETRFSHFLEEFRNLIRKAIRSQCARLSEAETKDVEQEIHLKIWEILKQDKEIHHLASYIYRIAATTTIDALRRIRARCEEPLIVITEKEESDRQSNHPYDREIFKLVEKSINKLPADRALAVRLYLQGYTSNEIAKLTDWTENKARNLAHRGMNDLRALLRKEGVEYEGN